MRREQYWPDKDPVSRRIGDDVLGRALRKVLRDSERRLLLDYLHGAPLVQMARQFGWTVEDLQELIRSLLIRLRDSEFGPQLREELLSRTGPQHSALVWEGVKEVPVHRCQRVGCTHAALRAKGPQAYTQVLQRRVQAGCLPQCEG